MEEIRFHGRGGQGAVIGSEILAYAFFVEGKYVQAFPQFAGERRGAPVTAFCRVHDQPIHLRCQIYTPDHLIVLDESMLKTANITVGLKPQSSVLVNGKSDPVKYQKLIGTEYRIFLVDGTGIALEYGLGNIANPIVNTAMLGAFAKASGIVSINSVLMAIKKSITIKKESNMQSAQSAYERVVSV